MKLLWFTLLTSALLTQVACSRQWRESKEVSTSAEVMAALYEAAGVDVESEDEEIGGDFAQFVELAEDPYTTIYYADSSTSMGPAPMVASFSAFDFMAQSFTLADVSRIRVFFLDKFVGGTHENALMIDAIFTDSEDEDGNISEDGYSTDAFYGTGAVSGGRFTAQLDNSLVVKSYDVNKNNELNGTIQLKVYLSNSGSPIGKFPTLIGYQ